MELNYHLKRFRVESNSDNGEIDPGLVFEYKQDGNVLWCNYADKNILKGHLLGKVSKDGVINMSYHQILASGVQQSGVCTSTPELLSDGRIRLLESWQ